MTANQQAYEAANPVLIERADRLVAVWSGEPPTGKGGSTADTFLEAQTAGIPVDVVAGRRRSLRLSVTRSGLRLCYRRWFASLNA